jgi:hypothetical protein
VSLGELTKLVEDLSQCADIPCLAEKHVVEAVRSLSMARVIAATGLAEAEARIGKLSSAMRMCSDVFSAPKLQRLTTRNVVCRFVTAADDWIARSVFVGWLHATVKLSESEDTTVLRDASVQFDGGSPASFSMQHCEWSQTPSLTGSLLSAPSCVDKTMCSAKASVARPMWLAKLSSWVNTSCQRDDFEVAREYFTSWRQETYQTVIARTTSTVENLKAHVAGMGDTVRIIETTKSLQEEALVRMSQKFQHVHEQVATWSLRATKVLLLSRCFWSWQWGVSTARSASEVERLRLQSAAQEAAPQ